MLIVATVLKKITSWRGRVCTCQCWSKPGVKEEHFYFQVVEVTRSNRRSISALQLKKRCKIPG